MGSSTPQLTGRVGSNGRPQKETIRELETTCHAYAAGTFVLSHKACAASVIVSLAPMRASARRRSDPHGSPRLAVRVPASLTASARGVVLCCLQTYLDQSDMPRHAMALSDFEDSTVGATAAEVTEQGVIILDTVVGGGATANLCAA